MKDVRGLYVRQLDGGARAAEFQVHDLANGSRERLPAAADEVLALAIRFQQPVLLSRTAVTGALAAVLPGLALHDSTDAEDMATLSRLAMLVSECAPPRISDGLFLAVKQGEVSQADWACDSGDSDGIRELFAELRELARRGALAPRRAAA